MLSAAQAAEESRQNISNAALTAINAQGFMMTPMAGAQADAIQAETTITAYKRAEIICFGCGQKHPWSKKQDDSTYVVICPNKAKPGFKADAAVKIAKMKVKRKAQRQGRKDKKKQKTTVNAAFEALTDEQRALCIKTATRITANSATSSATQPSSGSTRTVFVVNAASYAADVHRQQMPIPIVQCLPHMKLSLGPSLETANCPDIFVAIDTCAGIVTG
jgi:hypothetical protein